MRIKLLTLIFSVLFFATFFSACKKDNSNNTSSKPPVIEVTVQPVLSGIPLQLLLDQDTTVIKGTTNSSGKVDFNVSAGKTYYIYNDPSDQKIITDPDATYIILGTFTSQSQINSSPYQGATTKVGDDIYKDINGDGAITNQDKVKTVVAPAAGGTTSVTLVLGDKVQPATVKQHADKSR